MDVEDILTNGLACEFEKGRGREEENDIGVEESRGEFRRCEVVILYRRAVAGRIPAAGTGTLEWANEGALARRAAKDMRWIYEQSLLRDERVVLEGKVATRLWRGCTRVLSHCLWGAGWINKSQSELTWSRRPFIPRDPRTY